MLSLLFRSVPIGGVQVPPNRPKHPTKKKLVKTTTIKNRNLLWRILGILKESQVTILLCFLSVSDPPMHDIAIFYYYLILADIILYNIVLNISKHKEPDNLYMFSLHKI